MTTVLVVGVGHRDRGDDAVGPAVTGRLRELGLAGVRIIEEADPVLLLDSWESADVVVVADAVRSGRRAGSVCVLHAGHGPLPVATGPAGTHDFGLGRVIELARSLGRLPTHLVIVGIEGGDFSQGRPMSPAVVAAVDQAARTVAGVVRATR